MASAESQRAREPSTATAQSILSKVQQGTAPPSVGRRSALTQHGTARVCMPLFMACIHSESQKLRIPKRCCGRVSVNLQERSKQVSIRQSIATGHPRLFWRTHMRTITCWQGMQSQAASLTIRSTSAGQDSDRKRAANCVSGGMAPAGPALAIAVASANRCGGGAAECP